MCPRSIWEPCPKLQIIESGPKAEGSLSTWGKVINTLKSLLEQKESFDRAEVCSVCHFAWSCFDYSGYCMGWLNSPVSTPFAWKMTSNQNYHILTDGKQWYSRFCKNLKLFFCVWVDAQKYTFTSAVHKSRMEQRDFKIWLNSHILS